VRLVSDGWEAIGLGAITDVVQHAFGPVDLDRSLVELAARSESIPGCPACAGHRFGFPAELAEARGEMCPAHQHEASSVINARIARANASNPDGWGALADASARLGRPHLPNGLATKLADAGEGMFVVPERDVLATRAEHVVEAAGWFPGRPEELAVALGEEPGPACLLPEWLVNLVADLGRAGLGAEAVRVGDALARVDPENRPMHDGDVAVALAEAGLVEQAKARIEANLTRWPDDFWIRVHAGDAMLALGDLDGAKAHFEAAVGIADDTDDFESRHDAVRRLRKLSRLASQGEHPRGQRRQPKRKLSKSQRKQKR
jgi:tetratricopeptide (TPR) repeat protein